jgi:hypothetical protein
MSAPETSWSLSIKSEFVILRLDRSRKLSGQKALKTLDSRLRENDEFFQNQTLWTGTGYNLCLFRVSQDFLLRA